MKTVNVVAAIIYKGCLVFATQRGYGEDKDWWEFPGGKIESGETPEVALRREIREELEVEITVEGCLATVEYDYPDYHLNMKCYWAQIIKGKPVLVEHEAARWLSQDELDDVNWLPADRTVLEKVKIGLSSK